MNYHPIPSASARATPSAQIRSHTSGRARLPLSARVRRRDSAVPVLASSLRERSRMAPEARSRRCFPRLHASDECLYGHPLVRPHVELRTRNHEAVIQHKGGDVAGGQLLARFACCCECRQRAVDPVGGETRWLTRGRSGRDGIVQCFIVPGPPRTEISLDECTGGSIVTL